MTVIIDADGETSKVFTISEGKQVTLTAYGLSKADSVVLEIVRLSDGVAFSGDPCNVCLSPSIEVIDSTPLLCPNRSPVVMTKEYPYVVIDAPQNTPIRARVISALPGAIKVEAQITDSRGEMANTCSRALPCASMPLSCDDPSAGYGYHVSEKDVLATVEMPDCSGGDSIWIYPEAGFGHTIRVEDCEGETIGYANNCPCPCGV